ncbi:gamma-mobile-trio integrase GmtZ [Bosea sp. NPDC055353]
MASYSLDCYKTIRSELTGRELLINTSETLFLIPPTFDVSVARRSANSIVNQKRRGSPATPELRPYLTRFAEIESLADFANALDEIVVSGYHLPGNTNIGRIADILVDLWLNNCLTFPRDSTKYLGRFHGGIIFRGAPTIQPHPQEIIETLQKVNTFKFKDVLLRRLALVVFSITGIREIGDLTPSVVDGSFKDVKGGTTLATQLTTAIRSQFNSVDVTFSSNDYGPFNKSGRKSNLDFNWIIDDNPDLAEWRDLGKEWLEGVGMRDRLRRRSGVAQFLTYIASNPNVPRNPLEFLQSGREISPPFNSTALPSTTAHAVREFIDWVLNKKCVSEDDHGHPYRLPGFRNPISAPRIRNTKPPETVRDAMPTRFVRRLKEIIESDDYSWPRTAFEFGSDTFRWKDPATGEWATIWSPVRAIAILMKLELPERTFQVRVCNSGEADSERYDPEHDRWLTNSHRLAGKTPYARPMGLARKIHDHRTGKIFTGLYFNTNKTGDLGKSPENRGHVIPWHNQSILKLYDKMRSWQEKYNPVELPTRWEDLREDAIVNGVSTDIIREKGAETFLFRDPCSRYPEHPVTHTRLTIFWNKLCGELEDRLAREGETAPGGERIQLVTRNQVGEPSGTVYNLHALRVTMITAWAEAGVPIDILMKVAGHATAFMTIYYKKLSISHVSDVLNRASAQMMLDEQGNWQSWLRSKSYDELLNVAAYNDTVSFKALNQASNSSISRRDHGICPVGCGRCHEGGPLVEGSISRKHHPVPGGPQNCVRCRFFITGPCFLLGLQAHFDDVGFRYREASRAYAAATTEFDKLDYIRRRSVAEGQPFFDHHRLEILSSTVDQRTREVDELALTWHATYNLIEQCIELLRKQKSNETPGKNFLITVGTYDDIEYVLEVDNSGEREFELFDKLCHSSVFFNSINPRTPNVYRMRHFDQLIKRNGFEPIFFEMTEEEAFQAGNAFSKFLYSYFGRENVTRLIAGTNTLRSLGIAAEKAFSEKISEIGGKSIVRPSPKLRITTDDDPNI